MWKKILELRFTHYLYIFVFLIFVMRTAWVSDDAYITFRSVENLVSGFGPTFNVSERVQTFTHPLWYFLQSSIYYLVYKVLGINKWAQLYYINISASVFLSFLAICVLVFRVAKTNNGKVILILLLSLSKAYVDYSTSGLENTLSHFLLAIFLWVFYGKGTSIWNAALLVFIAALSGLNRIDTLLIYIPMLLYCFIKSEDKKRLLGLAVIGLSPLIVWEMFSLFYYGMPFPNTAYAKINTGIDKLSLFTQGLNYFKNSILMDPITLTGIFSGIAFAFIQRDRKPIVLSLGLLLYLFYILYVGGDFMSGRFLTPVILGAAVIISQRSFTTREGVWGGVIILFLGTMLPTSNLRSPLDYGSSDFNLYKDANGISDERAVYYQQTGLLKPEREALFPGSAHAGDRWILKENLADVVVVGPLGMRSYQAGPSVHMIDKNALASPLMSRLPLIDYRFWRIGHFRHIIPDGYVESLASESNLIREPNLAEYYDVLHFITASDLFDRNRLVAILNFNLGRYDYLLQQYEENLDR